MGSVRRVKGSRFWQMRYIDQDGIRREQSSETTDYLEARRKLKHLEGQIADGKPVTPQTNALKVADLLQNVLNDYKLNNRKSTHDLKTRCNEHLVPYLGAYRAVSLRTSTIREYCEKRRTEGAANGTINRELTALKRAYSLAKNDGLLFSSPHIPMLPEAPPRSGFFSGKQLAAILGNLPPAYADFVEFGAITGWRRSEIAGLEWRNVGKSEIRLDPGTTKSGKGRVFPITKDLRRVLDRRKVARDTLDGVLEPRVFWYPRGPKDEKKPAPIQQFRKTWEEACKAAGCPGRVFHDLRRSAYKRLAAAVGEYQAMRLVGWTRRETADRYFEGAASPSDTEDLRKALDGEVRGEVGLKKARNPL